MATYVALLKFTAQGAQNIHESPHRAASFKSTAKKVGAKISHLLWTMGAYDGVIVFEASDDAVATGLMTSLSTLGNVSTTTLRSFNAVEFAAILHKAPGM